MEFLSRVMKYLFWLLVVSWSVALLRRAVAWMLRGAMQPQQAGDAAGPGDAQSGLAPRRLVRDPVCGMHVAEELAIPLRNGGALLHFCSTACRDKYANSTQRVAANG
jgi:YHS domain-containing protein